ncbi:HAD-like protein [Pseudovirgaria hyperparasitica]|uniref:HAD-like protein n=1 Tax=Pseudovirgaria hyperparasitica TaxID=470096 RepID=A0A6A6WFP6_9PEZI|nr:HAD-like protein [Pseudovirgaria hyperparasitica]KAF2761563.1 HAD-like protein [Pseudovirgaria hyperparasitica]
MRNQENQSISASAEVHCFNGLLFDMDGTIIDSTDAIIQAWHKIGKELGVDPDVILATSHGRRSIDTIREYDPEKANWDFVSKMEGQIPREFGSAAVEVPGSRALLDDLEKVGVPWAIVTSGTRPLVTGWLDVMKLAHPKFLVVAEDVQHGKPDPTCYQMGASMLKLERNAHILVLEDAPAGVRAGKAAGFKVVALNTTHTIEQLKEAGADWIVHDMRSVTMKEWDKDSGTVKIQIANSVIV